MCSWSQSRMRWSLTKVGNHFITYTRKDFNLYWTRQAEHCWRSRDELIRDVLLWTTTHGRAKAGRPARTYIQQRCEDTGCCPNDLPRAMNDREEWRERVRDIRATSAIWWWWFCISVTDCHLVGDLSLTVYILPFPFSISQCIFTLLAITIWGKWQSHSLYVRIRVLSQIGVTLYHSQIRICETYIECS